MTITTYKFSESLSLANDFAIKLLSGLLNMRTDYESGSCALVDVSYVTPWFSTNVMEDVRIMFDEFDISKLEATDITSNPNSLGTEGEIRHVTVFAKGRHSDEIRVATFSVERDYLDGERATGWTKWRIENIHILPDGSNNKLVSEQIDRDDDEVVWGESLVTCPSCGGQGSWPYCSQVDTHVDCEGCAGEGFVSAAKIPA